MSLNYQQKKFVKETINYFFGIPKDEVKIRSLILMYLEEFSDEELIEYSRRLNEMRPLSYEMWIKNMIKNGELVTILEDLVKD